MTKKNLHGLNVYVIKQYKSKRAPATEKDLLDKYFSKQSLRKISIYFES